jgi:hypothetical protein
MTEATAAGLMEPVGVDELISRYTRRTEHQGREEVTDRFLRRNGQVPQKER